MSEQRFKASELGTVDEDLSALLDGELEDVQVRQLRDRIAREPDLAQRLTELGRLDASLRGVAEEPVTVERVAAMRVGLQRRLDTEPRIPQSRGDGGGARVISLRRHVRWAAPFAAALAAGVALYLTLGPSPDRPASLPGAGSDAVNFAAVSDEEIAIALEYETLADLEVIEQLDVLELLAAVDPSGAL
jgi:anti-sigma factor RsiW